MVIQTRRCPAGTGHRFGHAMEIAGQLYGPRNRVSRPLAPFGKDVAKEISAGNDPDVHLFASPDGWSAARHRIKHCGPGTAMVLPEGDDPASYRWPRLSYPTVVMTGLDGEAVRHLVAVLIASGIECIALCDACNGSRSAIVKASALREAA